MKTKLIVSLFLIITQSYTLNTYSDEQIQAHYRAENTDKYRIDNLPL